MSERKPRLEGAARRAKTAMMYCLYFRASDGPACAPAIDVERGEAGEGVHARVI